MDIFTHHNINYSVSHSRTNTFVHTKYGNQAENHTKNETKDYKNIHIAIINEDQPTKYNGKN